MSGADDAFRFVAERLSDSFDLDVVSLRRAGALRTALDEALVCMDADTFVDQIVAQGSLRSSANRYAVLIWRARRVVADLDERAGVAEEAAERRRIRQVEAAARFGQQYRDLLDAGEVDSADAEAQVVAQFPEPEVAAVALAAVRGRR
jgi:hypothetical protein